MKANRRLLVVTPVLAALAAPALAGPVGVARPSAQNEARVVERLAAARNEANDQARLAVKGSAATAYRFRAVKLDDLIKRVEQGEQVSPEEIDRALKR